MLLVDTSIWIDHLHRGEPRLEKALGDMEIVCHPMVIGELALGTLKDRTAVLGLLADLPVVTVASHIEMLTLVERHELQGRGLGVVDAHLVASARLSPDVTLWTRDKRLKAAAATARVPTTSYR